MEKGKWKRKVEEEDEDKDEEMKMNGTHGYISKISMTFIYIPFYPTLDSNGSNRVLDHSDSTLSNDSIQ
ncbi:hypothetical protein JCGZ_04858 [Jatropha curcas]|uniref:Uncharacterized protein n=1 Tax=Jatropha curcas TaxID=180498 RepID=A0A067L179_JATCU|nr:hypothetical protein JCGZ_04858 [Jatropha curcas]